MRIYKGVRSTAEFVPSVEVNIDTVYIRSNIVRVEEIDFSGWEYDEIQYNKDRYIELISNENKLLELKSDTLIDRQDFLEDVITEVILTMIP